MLRLILLVQLCVSHVALSITAGAHGVVGGQQRLQGSSHRFERFTEFIVSQQAEILTTLASTTITAADPGNIIRDPWSRVDEQSGALSGWGTTVVIEDGAIIEKGGVSTTIQSGVLSPERALAMTSRQASRKEKPVAGMKYFAAALSLVLHSRSPLVPTFRSDVRYFELENGDGWFGGGADLTPFYVCDDDVKEFHASYKSICDNFIDCDDASLSSLTQPHTHPHPPQPQPLYRRLKKWCDDYFYIPAREEHRGVGGIFFDDLSCLRSTVTSPSGDLEGEGDIENAMQFTQRVCQNFMPSYLPIVAKRGFMPFTEEQRQWQLLRRGRYIEFNLLYDRGVKFGMIPGGRIEAVLVSCPPLVSWKYKSNELPEHGREEEKKLLALLKTPREWI